MTSSLLRTNWRQSRMRQLVAVDNSTFSTKLNVFNSVDIVSGWFLSPDCRTSFRHLSTFGRLCWIRQNRPCRIRLCRECVLPYQDTQLSRVFNIKNSCCRVYDICTFPKVTLDACTVSMHLFKKKWNFLLDFLFDLEWPWNKIVLCYMLVDSREFFTQRLLAVLDENNFISSLARCWCLSKFRELQ